MPTLTEKLVFLTISWYLEDNTHQKTLKSQDILAFTVNFTLKYYSERDYTSRYPDGESSCGFSVTLSGSFIMESDFSMTSEKRGGGGTSSCYVSGYRGVLNVPYNAKLFHYKSEEPVVTWECIIIFEEWQPTVCLQQDLTWSSTERVGQWIVTEQCLMFHVFSADHNLPETHTHAAPQVSDVSSWFMISYRLPRQNPLPYTFGERKYMAASVFEFIHLCILSLACL